MKLVERDGLSFFGIYRPIAPKSPRYAHYYRSGIIGYLLFCPFGLLLAKCINVFGNHPLVNAIDCAWIHIACLWTFGGLLLVTLTTAKKLGGNS